MASLRDVAIGLEIFRKYGESEVHAERDVIYAGPSIDVEISSDDKRALSVWGWFQDVDSDSWARHV